VNTSRLEGTDVDRKHFKGYCDQCNTEYETSSARDNLSGIKFKCKKHFCKGEIVLEDNTYQKWKEERYDGKYC